MLVNDGGWNDNSEQRIIESEIKANSKAKVMHLKAKAMHGRLR